jgi:hypothetical protein
MSYPTFKPNGDISYKIGSFAKYVPPFLADAVMIQPANEYGMNLQGFVTQYGGSSAYWINALSSISDPAMGGGMVDLQYLQSHDLAVIPHVKRVVIAVRWYTALETLGGWEVAIGPAIGPEVQSWNWYPTTVPPEYRVANFTRANSYWLLGTHQVWPTPDDQALVEGVRWLQAMGYEVGICPIATMVSRQVYWANGGEWEVDRWAKQWMASQMPQYLAYYDLFVRHYIDLMANNNIRPWIMYLGYAMRDLTWHANPSVVNQFIMKIHDLADHCKAVLPNTLTTYAADMDEYYYPYLIRQSNCYLDSLWTIPSIDLVGVNWFAPLVTDDNDDNPTLEKGVIHGEADSFYLPGVGWRGIQLGDRMISNTTRNFKTGIAQTPINPGLQGIKNIIDWARFYHYYPAVSTNLAGATPLPGIPTGDPRMCSAISGLGPVQSLIAYSPTIGGIAPAPALKDTWLLFQLHSYAYLSMPASIPDPSVFNFELIFELNDTLTDLTKNYRLLETSFGLKIDSIDGTILLWFLQTDGSYLQYPLFSSKEGQINLVYKKDSIQILVDGAYDLTVTPHPGAFFQMPGPLDKVWMGNPQNTNLPQNTQSTLMIPGTYGVWQGKFYFLSFTFGTGASMSGSQYFFDDSYSGVRTAWDPGMKGWMATSFGYGSIRGSAADPVIRPQTVTYPGGSAVPAWYADDQDVTNTVFRGNLKVWNVIGPYGSTFDPDDTYQAVVLNAASRGLIEADAVHQVAWYLDTRSGGAFQAKTANGVQIFNDALDYDINSALNGKAAVRYGGSNTLDDPLPTIDNMLGLSVLPGPEPPIRAILVEPGVPQK